MKLLYVRKTINFRFINFKIVIYCRFMSFLGSDLLSISFCHLIEREKCARDKLENGLKNLSTSPILTRHNATERQKSGNRHYHYVRHLKNSMTSSWLLNICSVKFYLCSTKGFHLIFISFHSHDVNKVRIFVRMYDTFYYKSLKIVVIHSKHNAAFKGTHARWRQKNILWM